MPRAIWNYPRPSRAAEGIQGRVAFWRGVKIVDGEREPAARKGRGLVARLLRAA